MSNLFNQHGRGGGRQRQETCRGALSPWLFRLGLGVRVFHVRVRECVHVFACMRAHAHVYVFVTCVGARDMSDVSFQSAESLLCVCVFVCVYVYVCLRARSEYLCACTKE